MLTVNVRGPLFRRDELNVGPIRYTPPTWDYTTGYGRLSLAVMGAINTVDVGQYNNADFGLCWPGHPETFRIRFTMWEPDAIPQQASSFMRDGALVVPCSYNNNIFRSAGFKNNIHVVPLWGEAEYSKMPDDSTLRFICVARDSGVRERKGIDSLIKWFSEAFPSEDDVALTIKNSRECFIRNITDKRITVIRQDMTHADYNIMLSQHHCGVFLSGLEAWNFPACELMAAGRPSILVPFGGPTEFSTASTSWHLPYEMAQAPDGHPYYGVGRGAKPLKDGVIAALRECYNNRSLMNEKALASAEAAKHFTKRRFAERLRVVVLSELGRI